MNKENEFASWAQRSARAGALPGEKPIDYDALFDRLEKRLDRKQKERKRSYFWRVVSAAVFIGLLLMLPFTGIFQQRTEQPGNAMARITPAFPQALVKSTALPVSDKKVPSLSTPAFDKLRLTASPVTAPVATAAVLRNKQVLQQQKGSPIDVQNIKDGLHPDSVVSIPQPAPVANSSYIASTQAMRNRLLEEKRVPVIHLNRIDKTELLPRMSYAVNEAGAVNGIPAVKASTNRFHISRAGSEGDLPAAQLITLPHSLKN